MGKCGIDNNSTCGEEGHMRWPRGRHNGQRIAGVDIKFRLNVFWWAWEFKPRYFGTFRLHAGPFHLWINLDFEDRP